MARSCGFTGHRPQRFPWRFHETAPACAALKAALKEQVLLLTRSGTTDFYSGMALGVDTWAAEAVLELRGKYPSIKLHCVLPCKNQDAKWNAAAKETYQTILAQADSIQYVSQFYNIFLNPIKTLCKQMAQVMRKYLVFLNICLPAKFLHLPPNIAAVNHLS